MPAQYLGLRDIWGDWWEVWQVGDKLIATLVRISTADVADLRGPVEVAAHDAETLAAAALDLQTEIACEQQS